MQIKDSANLCFTVQATEDDGECTSFEIYQEPSRAQKEINDDDPPGPWPWWINMDDTAGALEPCLQGPFQNKIDAVNAALNYVLNRR